MNSLNLKNLKKLANIYSKNERVMYFSSKTKLFYSDIIEDTLFSDSNGYYSNLNISPIKKLKNRLNFKEITNINKYYLELESKYPVGSYSTAPEVLFPFFGFGIGLYIENYIKNKYSNLSGNEKIKIYEIGCGMGGLAESILDYFKYYNSEYYSKISYNGYERNSNMANYVKNHLSINHSKKFEIYDNWKDSSNENKLSNKNLNAKIMNEINNDNKSDIKARKNDKINFNNSKSNKEISFVLLINYLNSINHERLNITNNKKLTSIFSKIINKNIVKNRYDSDKREFCNYECLLRVINDSIIELNEILSNNSNDNLIHIYYFDNIKKSESLMDLKDLYIYDNKKYNKIVETLLLQIFLDGDFYSYLFNSITIQTKNESLIVRLIDKIQRYFGKSYLWLPIDLVETLKDLNSKFNLTEKNVLIYDFDFLINNFRSDFKGINGPQIYQIMKDSNKYKDLYNMNELINRNDITNIYFPVDFQLTKKAYSYVTSKELLHYKHSRFFELNSLNEWFSEFNSFNSLKETHLNSSFLCSI